MSPAWAQTDAAGEVARPNVTALAAGTLLGSAAVMGAGVILCQAEEQNSDGFVNICGSGVLGALGFPVGGAFGASFAAKRSGFALSTREGILASYLSAVAGLGVGLLTARALDPGKTETCVTLENQIVQCTVDDPTMHDHLGLAAGAAVHALLTAHWVRGKAQAVASDPSPVEISVNPTPSGANLLLRIRF